jgi:ribA/ribD-fused uncharacterized protein
MITKFTLDYAFLSNFFPSIVKDVHYGFDFPTVEHAFQASKCVNKSDVLHILKLPRPHDARKFGRGVDMRKYWEDEKLGVMENLIRQKFITGVISSNHFTALRNTGTVEIVENNNWHDNYWGSCTCSMCGNIGDNNLGKILMKIRNEIHQRFV